MLNKKIAILLAFFLIYPIVINANNLLGKAYRIANKRHVKHAPEKPSSWFVGVGKYYAEAKTQYTGSSESIQKMNKHVNNGLLAEKQKIKKQIDMEEILIPSNSSVTTRRVVNRIVRNGYQEGGDSGNSNNATFQGMAKKMSNRTEFDLQGQYLSD
jgi:hypothetical protein